MELHSEDYAFSEDKMRLPGTRLGRLLERLAREQPLQANAQLVFEGEQTIRLRGMEN